MVHRSLGSLALLVTLLSAAPAAAFEPEFDAYRATLDGFFAGAFAARADCQAMGTAMRAWLDANQDTLKTRADTFAAVFAGITTEDRFTAVDGQLTELWGTITSNDGLVLVGACMGENPVVGEAIKRFDTVGTEPVTRARDEARARLDEAATRNRPADQKLADLAAGTLGRTLSLYATTVEAYGGDCRELARALDAWHGNYFEMIDQPSKDLIAELARMSPEQKRAFAPNLQPIEAARAAAEKVDLCVAKLAGEPHDRLAFQHTFMSVYVIDSVLTAAR